MKKVILVIISVFCLVTTVYANEECFLGLSSDMDNPCKVLVNIENAEHIYGGSFILEYDNNTIEVIDCKEGSPLENITAIINKSYADDKIKLTWASANEVTYDEPILYIEFKAVDTNVDQTEICFSEVVLYDIDSNEAQCKTDKFLLTLPGNNRVTLPEYEENLVSRPTSGSSVSRYTVKFETNGGSEVENKTVNRNAVLEAPEAPTKDGFKFDGFKVRFIEAEGRYKIGDVDVLTLELSHDTPVTFGFIIIYNDKQLGYITDTGIFPSKYKSLISNMDAIIIESNHNVEMLINSKREQFLIKRILSPKGHLSNQTCFN